MSRALAHYTIHRLRRKLRDASGIQHLSDAFFINIILVGFAAGGLHFCVQFRNTEEIRALGCYANLLRIERGAEAREFTCPIANLRYRVEERTTGTVIGCPDPNKHLRLDSYLARRGERWELQANFASALGSTDSTNEMGAIELENAAVSLEVEPPGITLEIRPAFLFRYVVLPLGLMLSIFMTFGGFFTMVSIARDSGYSTSDTLIEIAVIFVLLVCVLGMGSLTLAITLGGWDERLELDQEERSITVRECVFSRWRCSDERLDSVRSVLPVFVDERFRAVAYYEKDGELHHHTLFRSSGKDWESVALMDGLFSSP